MVALWESFGIQVTWNALYVQNTSIRTWLVRTTVSPAPSARRQAVLAQPIPHNVSVSVQVLISKIHLFLSSQDFKIGAMVFKKYVHGPHSSHVQMIFLKILYSLIFILWRHIVQKLFWFARSVKYSLKIEFFEIPMYIIINMFCDNTLSHGLFFHIISRWLWIGNRTET